MDEPANIVIVMSALLLAAYVGAHTVRWRLNRWIDRELAGIWEDRRYDHGYRDALLRLKKSLVQWRPRIHWRPEGEI